jgi:ABC-type Na+ efflux pump permease subunit
MVCDPVNITNFVLCIVILALGIWAYVKKKNDVPLYIGIAFGLFALSHLMTLLGLAAGLSVFLIIIRLIAYLLVVAALCRILVKK